jgi:hypothetical protein
MTDNAHVILSDFYGHKVVLCAEELCELLGAIENYDPRRESPTRYQ